MPLISLHQTIGALFPGSSPPAPQTYAVWPVWRDSTTKEVKFQPVPKRQALKIWHDARRYERQTRRPGKQDGVIGRNGLAVLHALLFDLSLARRRQRLSQAMVRSTIQRLGSCTNPDARSDRRACREGTSPLPRQPGGRRPSPGGERLDAGPEMRAAISLVAPRFAAAIPRSRDLARSEGDHPAEWHEARAAVVEWATLDAQS
jgi:hypothetical protein